MDTLHSSRCANYARQLTPIRIQSYTVNVVSAIVSVTVTVCAARPDWPIKQIERFDHIVCPRLSISREASMQLRASEMLDLALQFVGNSCASLRICSNGTYFILSAKHPTCKHIFYFMPHNFLCFISKICECVCECTCARARARVCVCVCVCVCVLLIYLFY